MMNIYVARGVARSSAQHRGRRESDDSLYATIRYGTTAVVQDPELFRVCASHEPPAAYGDLTVWRLRAGARRHE